MNSKLESLGIKCDFCTWKDTTVSIVDMEIWINKPCPECGNNLLTLDDFINAQILINAVEVCNKIDPEEITFSDEDIEVLKNSPIFRNCIGLNDIDFNSSDKCNIEFDTHNGIRAINIIKTN